jgi:GIY-YIG catalytic domain
MENNFNRKNIKKIPVVTYIYANIDKYKIYEENKRKAGIYRWNNLITGKSYIGSSINLTKRFCIYYSLKAMKDRLSKGSSAIYSALLKYGYSNFSLDILEYCESSLLIKKEQYYIDIFIPVYNILKTAGNRLGSKHSEVAKAKMKYKASISPLRKINHLLATGHITTIINKKDNSVKLYNSIRAAARDLGTNHNSLLNYVNTNKLYKDIYIISKNN